MGEEFQRCVVIGAGWMGASIAALVASAGVPTDLLDRLPPVEPGDDEVQNGFSRFSDAWRNSLAIGASERARSRGAFLAPEAVTRVRTGNIADHLEWIRQADWVIEAVPEVLDVKRATYERILPHLRPETVVSSNTSGILASRLAEGLPDDFAKRFMVGHFFNPVRYMRLLEIVANPRTERQAVERLKDFASKRLGKGVIESRDKPNFVANRIGLFSLLTAMHHAHEMGIGVREADRLTGHALGRASSATFRTADLIGLDALLLVLDNLHGMLAGDPWRERFNAPAFFRILVERGNWGQKSGSGFYHYFEESQRPGDETFNLDSLTYKRNETRRFATLDRAFEQPNPGERIRALISGDDEGARFAWAVLRDTLVYAAACLGEITDHPIAIDRAMRWGYNWDLGPFEIWNYLGLQDVAERIERDGVALPETAKRLLDSEQSGWYFEERGRRFEWDPKSAELKLIPRPCSVSLNTMRREHDVLLTQGNAVLADLGDGVACLSLASRYDEAPIIDTQLVGLIRRIQDECNTRKFKGLVILCEAADFLLDLDFETLLVRMADHDWDAIEQEVIDRQQASLMLKRIGFPVVGAISGRAIGAGCEIACHIGRLQVHAEAQFAIGNLAMGLIPSGGGTKELLYRLMDRVRMDGPHPLARAAFQTVFPGKVIKGAFEARSSGFLRRGDRLTMGIDRLLPDAKAMVLDLIENGNSLPLSAPFHLPGPGGVAALRLELQHMQRQGLLSPHDVTVGEKLAEVLCGGETSPFEEVSEAQLLDLERKAFVDLCKMEKTQQRIEHWVKTRRVLRN